MFNGMTEEDIFTMGYIAKPADKTYMTSTASKVTRPQLQVRLADPKLMPTRAHASDAGADLKALNRDIIYPGEMALVDTGVQIKIPVGYVGLVYSRSGQGKIRVSLTNSVGVIDSEYRGPIKVMLLNEGDEPYEIHPFVTKIAQLVVAPVLLPQFTESQESDSDWNNTARGTGGFGSTG